MLLLLVPLAPISAHIWKKNFGMNLTCYYVGPEFEILLYFYKIAKFWNNRLPCEMLIEQPKKLGELQRIKFHCHCLSGMIIIY